MGIDQIIALIVIVILLGIIVLRRVLRYRNRRSEEKALEENEAKKRKKSIEAIKKRSVGGETLIDYATYDLSYQEIIKYTLIAGAALFSIGYLFYNNLIISIIAALFGVIYPKFKKKDLKEKRKDELRMQFKEAISALSSSLAAGQSVENAFRDALKDLKLLYPDTDAYIIKEFKLINRRIENGEIVERAIDDFAKRSDIDDIKNFSSVFITCKRSGGDMVKVIKQTSDIITDKIEIQQDIKVLVSQKKFESKIMAVAPIAIMLFLKTTSPEFVEPLFDFGSPGPIIMTVALGLVATSMLISQRIMNIEA